MSPPGEAAPEEVLCRPPREAWPLPKVLNALLMKMGRTGPLAQPRRGPQTGKSGDPRSQNADTPPSLVGGHVASNPAYSVTRKKMKLHSRADSWVWSELQTWLPQPLYLEAMWLFLERSP